MAKPLTIHLTPEQQRELQWARDHHRKSYVRERAKGMSGRQVALYGLLRPRDPDTIYRWIHRYKAEGLEGLLVRPGRGRKPIDPLPQ